MTLDAGTDIETRSGGGTQLSGDNIVITSDVIEVTSATDDVEFISHSPQAESTTTKITVVRTVNIVVSSQYSLMSMVVTYRLAALLETPSVKACSFNLAAMEILLWMLITTWS